MIQKKKLIDWLTTSIAIAGEIFGDHRKMLLESGQGKISCPADILMILRKRGVVFNNSGEYYFAFDGFQGETIIQVSESDPGAGFSISLIETRSQ